MKLFEYLLSERLIVASGTPAIREIVSEQEVLFIEPDSAPDLAEAVTEAIMHAPAYHARAAAARTLGDKYSWNARATRILKFVEENA
jgi:glycosyltransferase involved in cell wall biosynthesis